MTPEQKLKQLIVIRSYEYDEKKLPVLTDENIDEEYDALEDAWDFKSELRQGDVETKLPCQSSRHYESKSVAAKTADGSWVGWTYWYGGGKHGEPEAIDWMDEAYDLNCHEEEKMMIIQTFTKR